MPLHRPLLSLALTLAACGEAETRATSPDAATTTDAATTDATATDATTTATGAPVSAADVSIVWPLPATLPARLLLSGADVAAHGPLIDPAPFERVPPIDAHASGPAALQGAAARAELRLVALRLDPCFGPADGTACRAQMRLVFQGLEEDASGGVTVADGAVHVFVEMPTKELLAVTRAVQALAAASGGYAPGPLGVHPILAREGLEGPFAAGLRQLVLAHAGAERSVRMTFFAQLGAGAPTWTFGVLDKVGGRYRAETIATAGAPSQTLTSPFIPGERLAASVTHPTTHPDDLVLLLDSEAAERAPDEARRRAFDAAVRIQNPRLHTPDTIDCVSCHTATPAIRSAEALFGLSATDHPERYPTPVALADPSASTLQNIHAFSYLGRTLAISTRTANETAAVVEAMNALLAR